jgi:translation initiation factor IF-2
VIGTVVEAQVDKAKGVVATLLVQNGSLETSDIVVAGTAWGRIRAMFDFRGQRVRRAGPSTPVQVMGSMSVPSAGDVFLVYSTDREARQAVEARKAESQKIAAATPKGTLEELFQKYQEGEVRELNLVVKADVQGSFEPIINSLNELETGAITMNILHAEAGNISESDVMLAAASKAIVIGFSVTADAAARRLAETEGVSIRLYNIIYRLTEDIEKALKGMLAPRIYRGTIRQGRSKSKSSNISKVGNIAGCRVTQGDSPPQCPGPLDARWRENPRR